MVDQECGWSAVVFRLYTFAREDRVVPYNATHFTFRSLFRGFPPFSFFQARPWIERFDISLPRLFARPSTVAPLSMRCRVNETRERDCTLVAVSSNHINRSLILQWCPYDVNIYFTLFHIILSVEEVGFNNTKDVSLIHIISSVSCRSILQSWFYSILYFYIRLENRIWRDINKYL